MSLRARFSPSSRASVFDLADDARHICPCFFFDLLEQFLTSFLFAHFSDLLQAGKLLLVEFFDFVGSFIQGALALVQVLFPLFQAFGTRLQLVSPPFQSVRPHGLIQRVVLSVPVRQPVRF
jgi:hypothetical protein